MSKHREHEFNSTIRWELRKEADYFCQYCGKSCQGHKYEDEEILEIHHKLPIILGGTGRKENGCPLCGSCHSLFDHLTLNHNIPFEKIMEEEKEYWLQNYPM